MPQKKDNVELICNIGELAGLFERSESLTEFLQTVVSVVAYHMSASVCSVYLLDQSGTNLQLIANQGLNINLVGKLRISHHEGITGLALKELRTIRTGHASLHANYKFIPKSDEEKYESFLASPILRGLNRIGVLVVQDTEPDYFTKNDANALQAIAAQLAASIENAKLFMSLHEGNDIRVAETPDPKSPTKALYLGACASKGIARGRATIVGQTDSFLRLSEEMELRHCTVDEFRDALQQSEEQIKALQKQLDELYADVAALIFSAHLLILKDRMFSGEMIDLMSAGRSPQSAITEVVNRYVDLFSKNSNPRFQEKVQDVKDVGHRILHNLLHGEDIAPDYGGEIVIVGELLPSHLVKFATQHVAGLIIVGGGVTSHVSILARSMEVPVILLDDSSIFDVREGTPILLDATSGTAYVEPSEEVTNQYLDIISVHQQVAFDDTEIPGTTTTRDGHQIHLLANINLLNELNLAKKFQAEGIGLYRSEFPFVVRRGFPSEEEQYRIYRKLVTTMKPRPITMRTLDIGGDKMVEHASFLDEVNPFLGLRALRFTLRNKDVFKVQLRAMLRSAVDVDLRIMFPMVASVDEFLEACDVTRECIDELKEEESPHCEAPIFGPMIELPSAVEVVEELAAESGFLCIGTNDLVQYILGVDRTNESIADYYVPYHPAVLRSLKRIVTAGTRAGIPVSICGDMAGDPSMLPFLIGIGITRVSIDVRLIRKVQQTISGIDRKKATALADEMLSKGKIRELTSLVGTQNDE